MGWGNQAGTDGLARNHLAPAAELLAGKAWESLRFFGRLLSPELDPRFVWRAVESAAVPLAIAVVGTMLGVVAAILLTYPHSASFQLLSERFSGESAPGWRRAWRLDRKSVGEGKSVSVRLNFGG